MNKQIRIQCVILLRRCCCGGDRDDDSKYNHQKGVSGSYGYNHKQCAMALNKQQQQQPLIDEVSKKRFERLSNRKEVSDENDEEIAESSSSRQAVNEENNTNGNLKSSATMAAERLMSTSLPQLNGMNKQIREKEKECNSFSNAKNISPKTAAKIKKSSKIADESRTRSLSMNQKFMNLIFRSSMKSLNKRKPNVQVSSEVERTSVLSTNANLKVPTLSMSEQSAKLLIMAEDDGGVYKGPDS